MCCFIIILQNYAANYWVTHGTPKSKLIIGMATYGRSFTLQDPTNFGMGAPVSGSGKAGNTTRSAGFLAYYEVRFIFLSKLKTAANIRISVIYLATYGASTLPLFRSLISIYICCEPFVMNISFFFIFPVLCCLDWCVARIQCFVQASTDILLEQLTSNYHYDILYNICLFFIGR